jgi:hypothetical protein
MKIPPPRKPASTDPAPVERLHIAVSDKLVVSAEGKLAIGVSAIIVIALATMRM